jgi:hypothetical protein
MGTRLSDRSPTPSHRFDDLKQLAGLPIDIAVVRTIAPKQRRELLSHVRFRRQSCILARLRDPVEGIAELTIDVALYDVGVAILHDLSIYTDGRKWWLIGRPGDVLFRLTEEGAIPTMTEPWAYPGCTAEDATRRRWSGISEAEALLGAYIWTA